VDEPSRTPGADRPDADPATPGLEVAAVARRLGVAAATLRSWHRRYGIGPRGHGAGDRRYYRADDVRRLRLMQEALTRGASAAEAARWALAAAPDAGPPAPPTIGPDRAEPAAGSGAAAPGPVLALAGHVDAARGLARAALALDPDAVRGVLRAAIRAVGVVRTWDDVARPVLVAVADRWAATGRGVEVEHLLSECLVRELDHAAAAAPPPRHPRPVLLASVPGEAHSLPLSALAAALAGHRVATRLLGAALPLPALAAALDRTAPVALFLWSQARPCPLEPLVAELRRLRCGGFVGGPGWAGAPVPPGITALATLAEAVDALSGAAGSTHAPPAAETAAGTRT
jgi:hypothetical protein